MPYEVIVIDNGSQDGASIDYLRQVTWIRLIERPQGTSSGPVAHKEAIDIGIEASRAPFVLAFHTDTIAIRDDWLSWHVQQIQQHAGIAAVGTYKLETKSWHQRLFAAMESIALARRNADAAGDGGRHYIRSHCALYRRETLQQLGLRYNDPQGETAGLTIHYALEANGYEARLLPVEQVMQRVVHLNHGTMVLIPDLGARRRTIRKGLRRITQFMSRPDIQAVWEDESLDHSIPTNLCRAA